MIVLQLPKKIVLLSIRAYQHTLSFDHSFWSNPEKFRICIHTPSCSQYGYEAIEKFGLFRGGLMAVARVLRCNGWSRGGYDPVPPRFSLKGNYPEF
jgi:putative membrane protein insertion efficiency factor